MFEIPGIVIALTILTIALMGGFDSKKRRRSLGKDMVFDPITAEYITIRQADMYRRDKSPLRLDVAIQGKNDAERRSTVADLNVGDVLYAGWTQREDRDLNREYSIVFIDFQMKIYAVAYDADKADLAHRYEYIQNVRIAALDKSKLRMVLDITFD